MAEPGFVNAQAKHYAYDQVKRLLSLAGGRPSSLTQFKTLCLCCQLAICNSADMIASVQTEEGLVRPSQRRGMDHDNVGRLV